MKKLAITDMVMIAMFTAVLAILSQISIPLPTGVPITLQTFAVALTGVVLGWQSGAFAVIIYTLIGLVGVPVFSQFTAGPGILFGMTGGFIFGFILLAAGCGLCERTKNKILHWIYALLGLLLCHAAGVLQFALVTQTALLTSIVYVSLPYLIKDIASVILAFVVGVQIKKRLKGILPYAKA